MPVPNRLRDLIRNVRSCKTAAEEREVIQKECADIRNGFRGEDNVFRCRNVAKVLYIYMLGYPSHFGQLEALKLIVSSRFTDKRFGYLGAMLLLDEHREVHLLMTNSLKNDMGNTSQYVQSLALCTLGNVCSTEMARDLALDVEKLMKNGNAYIKKKAILCACRIVRKVPEMMENYMPLTRSLLVDKNHGVMLATVALITEMCKTNLSVRTNFKKLVPTLVRTLKNLIMAGYSPEHDVNGISDPFLQVRIIRLLRILGQQDAESSEVMNDVLAQVATNTETSKNVGNAILYETVITIMEIKSESGLRVLAVNILGRFLLNTDKNIRYVALNSLLKTVHTDMTAVQRHRTTILDCLKDPDPSILRPAMSLCFALINNTNVRGTVRELITFLSNCPIDFKGDCSSGIFLAAEKYSPNTRWRIDTMLKVLTTAGNYVRDDVVPSLIHLLSDTDKMHGYATNKLYQAMVDAGDLSMLPLTQVTCWCLGEYGDELLAAHTVEEELVKVAETEVLELLDSVLMSSLTNSVTKSYAINAVVKLSARFPSYKNETESIVSRYSTSHNMEVQQRAVEYTALFKKHDHLRPGVLEHMPLFERPTKTEDNKENVEVNEPETQEMSDPTEKVPPLKETSNVDLLLGLVDLGDASSAFQPHPPSSAPMGNDLGNILDLGLTSIPSQPPTTLMPTPMNGYAHPPQNNNEDLLSGLDGPTTLITDKFMRKPADSVIAYDKGGLNITFTFVREPSTTVTSINLSATNSTNSDLTNFLFQAAVPKSFQLQMLPPSGSVVLANHGNVINQTVKMNNPNKVRPRLRMRIAYSSNGNNFQEMEEFNNFPHSTWQ